MALGQRGSQFLPLRSKLASRLVRQTHTNPHAWKPAGTGMAAARDVHGGTRRPWGRPGTSGLSPSGRPAARQRWGWSREPGLAAGG